MSWFLFVTLVPSFTLSAPLFNAALNRAHCSDLGWRSGCRGQPLVELSAQFKFTDFSLFLCSLYLKNMLTIVTVWLIDVFLIILDIIGALQHNKIRISRYIRLWKQRHYLFQDYYLEDFGVFTRFVDSKTNKRGPVIIIFFSLQSCKFSRCGKARQL